MAWLEEYLQDYAGAILVVSHDRYFLDSLVNVIYEIERTEATRYTGNYSTFVELKEKAQALQEKKYVAQQKEIDVMEDYIRRNIARATSSKALKISENKLNEWKESINPLKN